MEYEQGLIWQSIATIFYLYRACVYAGPEVGFYMVLEATLPFVEFVNRYS